MIKCRFEQVVDSSELLPSFVRDADLILIEKPGVNDIRRYLNIDYTITVDMLASGEAVAFEIMIPPSIKIHSRIDLTAPKISKYYRMFFETDLEYVKGSEFRLITLSDSDKIRVAIEGGDDNLTYRIGRGVFALAKGRSFAGLAVDRSAI